MRAIAIRDFGGTDRLERTDIPRPRPGRGEVLLRVVSAGVNRVDLRMRRGELAEEMPHGFPLIPGWDAAGVVEEFGEGVSGFRRGDRVWTMARKPVAQWGCYAEYVAVPETQVALMPSKLLFEEAAAVPLAGLAAWQSLFRAGGVEREATVLIHAAAGGVGHLAVQLAARAGARVLGTSGPDNRSFVLGLGAEVGIDYTAEDFTDVVRRHCPDGVDLVIDPVGGAIVERSLTVVRPGGQLISLVDEPDPELPRAEGVRASRLHTEPLGEQLRELARRIDRKELMPHIDKMLPLESAAEAHELLATGHVRGKLILTL